MKLGRSIYEELTRALPPSAADPSLQRVVIVSAYAGARFFKALRKTLAPDEVHVVLDAGTPAETLRAVKKALGRRLRKPLLVGSAPDLMHAKLYLCTWSVPSRSRPIFTLNLGSANASQGGFDPKRNAEAMAAIRVYPGKHRALFRYFEPVLGRRPGRVEGATVQVDNLGIVLPTFDLRDAKSPPGFDSWLQRGVLCHRFQPDPSFLSFQVRLRKPLPVEEDIQAALQAANLLDDGGIKSLRQRYVQIERAPREESSQATWRNTFFVETSFGHWTSEECYSRGRETFRPRGTDRRKAALARVASATEGEQEKWIRRFLDSLSRAEAGLQARGLDPGEWFGDKHTAGLDYRTEEARCRERVESDNRKARDDDFRDRWATGYDFPRVPQFRLDAKAWSDFTRSFATSVVLNAQKGRIGNLFTRVCRDFDGFIERQDEPEEVLKWWRFEGPWEEVLDSWREKVGEKLS